MSAKKKNGRFLFGVAGVAGVVTYLMWTGISDSMMYYVTPVELMASLEQDESVREVSLQVAGKLVPGTHVGEHGNTHRFLVADFERADVTIPVEFTGTLPDTFRPNEPDVEVVAKGRLREDGVFVATSVLTKCGSRYEASEADALAG
jgi:cytochrome c-type biogenesis protein CcmE